MPTRRSPSRSGTSPRWGYQETRSSALLQDQLRAAGFTVQAGVAGIPTAFVASFGQGKAGDWHPGRVRRLARHHPGPVCRAEAPAREGRRARLRPSPLWRRIDRAAIAVKDWLTSSGNPGTIRLYGTPAEEGGAGKVYLVREGLFRDVDAVLHWHASDRNDASPGASLANKSAKFRFRGKSSHAAASPDRGRSALDGVEAMNVMVNMLREHVPEDTRIHYVITSGGSAPNVVPDFAEVYYYVRHPDPAEVARLFPAGGQGGGRCGVGHRDHRRARGDPRHLCAAPERRAGQGDGQEPAARRRRAVLGRGTGVRREALGDTRDSPSDVEGVRDRAVRDEGGRGSTDVADVSWVAPTAGLRSATWVSGTPSHSWQATAAGGMSIGNKG